MVLALPHMIHSKRPSQQPEVFQILRTEHQLGYVVFGFATAHVDILEAAATAWTNGADSTDSTGFQGSP